ncbi:hypothetical protein DFH94DRAFT_466799 [Russula ochroleuca]|uniref:Uncharacterized protein n=1 Tax=Russula ochroleuca TaxID=152965 RepID=A0A9P5MVZ8_9AGAM|nr:hypothetical protein DFH94DRAFT_466799 [Russula ochroleuca]
MRLMTQITSVSVGLSYLGRDCQDNHVQRRPEPLYPYPTELSSPIIKPVIPILVPASFVCQCTSYFGSHATTWRLLPTRFSSDWNRSTTYTICGVYIYLTRVPRRRATFSLKNETNPSGAPLAFGAKEVRWGQRRYARRRRGQWRRTMGGMQTHVQGGGAQMQCTGEGGVDGGSGTEGQATQHSTQRPPSINAGAGAPALTEGEGPAVMTQGTGSQGRRGWGCRHRGQRAEA